MSLFLLEHVLNRFSKDIGFMDEVLLFQVLELFAVSVVIVTMQCISWLSTI